MDVYIDLDIEMKMNINALINMTSLEKTKHAFISWGRLVDWNCQFCGVQTDLDLDLNLHVDLDLDLHRPAFNKL